MADSVMENRRYNRLVVPLSVEFHTHLPETGYACSGTGILRDISLSGSFFHTESPCDFKPGQIVSLTIAAPLPFLDYQEITHLKAKGQVVRLEPPAASAPYYGIAVQFLEGLSFATV
jgi:hypothetical protein